jgi:hypothetical protein
MNLSAIGILADVFFYEIKIHSKNVELDTFVVMPNHVHGILVINNNDAGAGDTMVQIPSLRTPWRFLFMPLRSNLKLLNKKGPEINQSL